MAPVSVSLTIAPVSGVVTVGETSMVVGRRRVSRLPMTGSSRRRSLTDTSR